jgi:hypothetical protein
MNFISEVAMAREQVELKYCERCGGLFLRVPGSGVTYCAGCTSRMAAELELAEAVLPIARRSSRPPRLAKGPRKRDLQGMATVPYLHAARAAEARAC